MKNKGGQGWVGGGGGAGRGRGGKGRKVSSVTTWIGPKCTQPCPECPECPQSARDASGAPFTDVSRLSRVVPTQNQLGRRADAFAWKELYMRWPSLDLGAVLSD